MSLRDDFIFRMFLFLLVLVVGFFGFYYFREYQMRSSGRGNTDLPESPESYGSLVRDNDNQESIPLVAGEFIKYINSIDYSARNENPSVLVPNWNWEKDMLFADIVSIDSELKEIELIVNIPSREVFSKRRLVSKVSCDNEETARFYYENLIFLGGNSDLFSYADAGEHLYSFCLDPSCSQIGRSCILIER